MKIKVKARYDGKVLKPLTEVDLREGEEVEIEIKKKRVADKTFGLIPLDHEDIEEIIEDTEHGTW